MKTQPTCKERIGDHLAGRLEDLRLLFDTYPHEMNEQELESLRGKLVNKGYGLPDDCTAKDIDETLRDMQCEFGLSFDYIEPDTFDDQKEGFFCYQLSWGGPSDEFRFYVSSSAAGYIPHRIEYWFLDWFDGASETLDGENFKLLSDVFGWFHDCGSVEAKIEELSL